MNRFGVRHGLIGCAAIIIVAASLAPGDAFARGGRGGGGGARAGGFHGGGARMAGGARPSHPIAGRPGNPGRPIAGNPGRPVAGNPGYGWRGAGYGFAAGAAATGLYGYYNNYNTYNNGCYTDPNGNWVCPNQYPYSTGY